MAQNHLKLIKTTLENVEEVVNDFFKWCEQTGYNISNSKYSIRNDDETVVVMLQYRAKSNEKYEQG